MKITALVSKGQIKQVRNELSRTKDFVTTEIIKQSDQIKDNLKLNTAENLQKLKETTDDFKLWLERSITLNKNSISHIKDSCSGYFASYDKALESIQGRFREISETFIDYQSNYIKPAQINIAKLTKFEAILK